MKSDFPYPLTECALPEFCNPALGHVLSKPVRDAAEIIAGNGFVVLRAHRGRWLDSDFPRASAAFLERINKIPWGRFESLSDDRWRDLCGVRQMIDRRGSIGFWQDGTAKVSPSPVWRVGSVYVRLSLLQLIARLPRVAVAWTEDLDSPLWFRFTGGRGAVAHDRRLTLSSFSIFQPLVDPMGRIVSPEKAPAPTWGFKNWPPQDQSEY